jgi:uncharacterized protein (TIGR02996 family)
MHPEQAALLATVLDNPGDDTPRLVLADWLEENGQAERARFIRAQITGPICNRFHDYQGCDCETCWSERMLQSDKFRRKIVRVPNDLSCGIRRGFVWRVHVTLQGWLDFGPAVVREHPVERVVITDKVPMAAPIPTQWYSWVAWMDEGELQFAWNLPVSLFDHLAGFVQHRNRAKRYSTPDDAHADLSHACLAWARAQINEPIPG